MTTEELYQLMDETLEEIISFQDEETSVKEVDCIEDWDLLLEFISEYNNNDEEIDIYTVMRE